MVLIIPVLLAVLAAVVVGAGVVGAGVAGWASVRTTRTLPLVARVPVALLVPAGQLALWRTVLPDPTIRLIVATPALASTVLAATVTCLVEVTGRRAAARRPLAPPPWAVHVPVR